MADSLEWHRTQAARILGNRHEHAVMIWETGHQIKIWQMAHGETST